MSYYDIRVYCRDTLFNLLIRGELYMEFLKKEDVFEVLEEDMETSMMCYDDEATQAIIKFCYDSMKRALEELEPHRIPRIVK